MLFNSTDFAVFMLILCPLYFVLKHRLQNLLLLAASYVFYGWWNWRFLSLILISTMVDYVCGIKIHAAAHQSMRKRFLMASVCVNLGMLGIFKYFNFFAASFQQALTVIGLPMNPVLLDIALPVGISFYTFQTMSYTIDIYRKEIRPTRRFLDFALFVSFFPQLVAGPIERAKRLLPQVLSPRKASLDQFYEGCFLIFWGLFQKMFVADTLAAIVNPVFAAGAACNGHQVIAATYGFAFQIFCDFAGYSNIARGVGRCLGFELMVNFRLPYFAANPRAFWQRWHISLSTWLRDYLYIPLGGNRHGKLLTYRNLMITMLLGGLWHGAAWRFLLWGGYHGLLLILHRESKRFFRRFSLGANPLITGIWRWTKVLAFFHLACFGWLLFRVPSVADLPGLLSSMGQVLASFDVPGLFMACDRVFLIVLPLLCVQCIQYYKDDLLIIYRCSTWVRTAFYYVCFYLMIIYGATGNAKEFIYFQF